MTADNPYSRTEISAIPISHLKGIIEDEITSLLFDFGQKVGANDPEFDYLVHRASEVLRFQYPLWKLHYLDECLRKGKLDDYDKGQKVTMKRLEYWFKCFNVSTMDKRKDQWQDREYSEEENQRFAANGSRFPDIIKFRQLRKPEFDSDEWKLTDIE